MLHQQDFILTQNAESPASPSLGAVFANHTN